MKKKITIAVVGLGYVGLPLALAFGKSQKTQVIGFDVNKKRIDALRKNYDFNEEFSSEEIKKSGIFFTSDPRKLQEADCVIVAVPTPVLSSKKPDLSLVESASLIVGKHLKKGAMVVFESTVYPGVTEDICMPLIEKTSGLKHGIDWKIGYSPERINPGDHEHSLEKIVKVVSGADSQALDRISEIYSLVCTSGVYKAPNIKTAEAAKVIENIQRDLNIALMNELSLIFARLGIRTKDVLAAASTKWNFHAYEPGLVGGHCIGVDPYYLTYCAKKYLQYDAKVILAGRTLNDSMPAYVAQTMINMLNGPHYKTQKSHNKSTKRVLIMGLTFKENVKDTRNSKSAEIIQYLQKHGISVLAHDPLLDDDVCFDHAISIKNVRNFSDIPKVDGVIIPVIHHAFKGLKLSDFKNILKQGGVMFDVKGFFRGIFDDSSFSYYSL